MTVVWLSPGLPADRAELAAALPADLTLSAAASETADEVHALAVGSLCVATVFETTLLTRLAARPAGVRLLVVGPEGYDTTAAPAFGQRAPEMLALASSVGDLAAAIQRAIALEGAGLPGVAAPAAVATAPLDAVGSEPSPKPAMSARRARLVTAGAVLGGLAIGGIVIASTEGSSAASATGNGRGGFGNFGGGGTFPGAGGTGGTGTQNGQGAAGGFPGNVAGGQELLACIRKAGFTGTVAQLMQSASDPKLRQAFLTCVQRLRGGGNSGGG